MNQLTDCCPHQVSTCNEELKKDRALDPGRGRGMEKGIRHDETRKLVIRQDSVMKEEPTGMSKHGVAKLMLKIFWYYC
jgi:hypothetical protein